LGAVSKVILHLKLMITLFNSVTTYECSNVTEQKAECRYNHVAYFEITGREK